MANIMSMVKLQNKPSRNGFDLSRKVAFSSKISELIPVECIECIPGDSFKIKKQHFTRTLPVNTAAFTRIREYYDWFFVPTNLLWDKFNTFVTQMTDNNQKAQSITDSARVGNQHPYFTTISVFNYLSRFRTDKADYTRNFFGYDRPMLTSKLLDYLGYGSFYGVGSDSESPDNYPSPLLNRMGSNVMNPFPLLAYQKIYQDYYRNSQWENAYAPACNINYMNSADNLELPIENIDYSAENMFDLRYCNWNKDYFMGVLPNSQYGDEATVDLSSILNISQTSPFYVNYNNAPQGDTPQFKPSTAIPSTSVIGPSLNNQQSGTILSFAAVSEIARSMGLTSENLRSAFSILALRQAEAAQKWREITQSVQQDYKSQIEAHFGVNVSDAYSDRCKFIDGQVSSIDINEVTNQSFDRANSEASIKGKGVGSGEGYIEFDTKVHGYLMCIYHAMPILDYQITGIKRRNLKTVVTDYAIPEFDKTGMIKIPFVELTNERTDVGHIEEDLLGFAPQYYDYKMQYDEVKGAFAYGGLGAWVAPFKQDYLNQYLNSVQQAFGTYNVEYHFFKINPNVMNPIFIDQLDPDIIASSELSSDQLLINCAFDIKSVRNLDRNGLPY